MCRFKRNLRVVFGYSIRIDLVKVAWLSIYAFVRSALRASSLPVAKYFLYSASSLSVTGDVVRSPRFLLSLVDLMILISSFLSSCHEKAMEALCIGQIQTRLGVALVSEFSA